MAKATTIKVKLVSSADTGFYYVTPQELAHHDRQAGEEEIRPGRQEARRVPRSQDQIVGAHPYDARAPDSRAAFAFCCNHLQIRTTSRRGKEGGRSVAVS